MTYKQLLERYVKKHGELHKSKLLDKSLWLAWSIGLERNYTDLGTYVDKPGDHGIGPPCFAFDLGRKNRFFFKGWNYLTARRLAKFYWRERDALSIEYVILGHRIISREIPHWHRFDRDDSHMFHIHVSGIHE